MYSKKISFAAKIFGTACLISMFLTTTNNSCPFPPDKNGCDDQTENQQLFLDKNTAQENFQKTLCQLEEIYGDEFYKDITRSPSSLNASNRQRKILFLQLENWRQFSSLKPKEIDEILTEYFNLYPPNWTLRIKKVVFEKQNYKSQFIKNPEPDDWVAGLAECDPNDNLWKIHIYPVALKKSREHNPSELCEVFSHEIAHVNDWRSIDMTPEQKLRFFQETAERFNAPDHYADKDDYLNKISLNTPEQTAYRRVLEYWAIISNAYLEEKRGLSQKDAGLVKSIIQYTDPEFLNTKQEAKKQRRKLIDKIFYN